jgi:hypothetical protein
VRSRGRHRCRRGADLSISSPSNLGATAASPTFPAVAGVATTSSLSGLTEACLPVVAVKGGGAALVAMVGIGIYGKKITPLSGNLAGDPDAVVGVLL